ncbi:uncharacterized protein LOC111366989 [Olea europaea subsp. europaea]|uniref:Uncharacterized protein LOC111366989 n=1 Tax=Olea europaea subsp. europaea TaxID=158383 RepID=A0A8S0UUC2_OLEEU|nr:uncharacterized protein LOC111366989 [Olea europaea subsp. europaea]
MPLTGNDKGGDVERQLEAPMPWIGMYVAAASLVCSLAMAADVFHGFQTKKLWFPSKYFSINAASLSLLAVVMKLPVDLTTRMWAATDRLAKVSSLIFMSAAMGNFMTSLGSMNDKEILLNVIAIGILVITVMVNGCIQIIQVRSFLRGREMFVEEIIASFSILLLLAMLSASAIMVPTTKRYLELKYQEMLKLASDEELVQSVEFDEKLTTDNLREIIKKYWVMAETSSPQFVIVRSVTCLTSGVISLAIAIILAEAQTRMALKYRTFSKTASKYDWSTKWIVLAQSVGVIIGTIAPAFRWWTAVNFVSSENSPMSFKTAFKIESYWTRSLVEWKESSLPLQIRDRKWRKVLHDARRIILNLVISVQIFVVLYSKLVQFISICFVSRIIFCFHCIKRLKNMFNSGASRIHGISESESGVNMEAEQDLTRYVLLLEGEGGLPQKTLKNICNEVDKVIERGKKQQPENLKNLLLKIGNFSCIREIDEYQVPSLHYQEPPNCWSLTLVTLTSIAIAIPNIPIDSTNWLLSSVDEGLFYVKLIEKSLDRNGVRLNIRNAADIVWVALDLYRKWQDKDLHETSRRGRNSTEILQELSDEAEKIVTEFKRNVKDFLMENPLHWPDKVIAANSMYRITTILLLVYESDDPLTDEGLFNHLTTVIADVIASCLTNLTRVITMKCHQNAIEERERSVHQAALLLGETEEILKILQQHKARSLNMDKSAYIEKWLILRAHGN